MSIASSMKKAGYLLVIPALLLAYPIRGQETGQGGASNPPATEEQSPSTNSNQTAEEAKKPKPVAPAAPIQTPPESPTPPTNLKKVGDHWTPYDPPDPESFPEGAHIHIIVPHDTLWDLANTHFGNPYLWPQIWNENRYILDSHWIYPGDPVLLPPKPTVVSEIVPAEGQGEAPTPAPEEEPVAPAQVAETAPDDQSPEAPASEGPVADHTDVYCTGEIRADYKKTDLYIANEEQEGKISLNSGDLVYLNGGRDKNRVQAGAEFLIVSKEAEVFHPVTDKWLGTYVRRLGQVKVLVVQDHTAIAEITESCGDRIEVGFELEPYRELQVPANRQVPFSQLEVEPSGKANGFVVHLQDNITRAYTGKIVDVDLGSRDGLKPGDILLVYLPNVPPTERRASFNYKWGNRRFQSPQLRTDDSHLLYPRKPIGQLMVLTTAEKTSTTKILHSIREIEVGTRVELR